MLCYEKFLKFSIIYFCLLLNHTTGVHKSTPNSLPEEICTGITDSNLCMKIGEKFYIIEPDASVNWYVAVRSCRRHNGDLVTFQTEAELLSVSAYLKSKNYHIGNRWFWTAANDLGTEGSFFSQATGRALNFTRWSSRQPDNYEGNENCVHLWHHEDRWEWDHYGEFQMNDRNCAYLMHYICELRTPKFIHGLEESKKIYTYAI